MIGRNKAWKLGTVICCFIVFGIFFNIETITRQGINYQVRELKIPLYLKTLNFFDRHYNYKWLVRRILHNQKDESKKAKLIFQWTAAHIKKQPSELDIVDDHVWNIIVRGYGEDDQAADVCATLSNYAGLKGFLLRLKVSSGSAPNRIRISAIYFDGAWHLSDPYRHTTFENKKGKWATINEIVSGDWEAKSYKDSDDIKNSINYQNYFQDLDKIDFNSSYGGSRSSIQDPVSRLLNFLFVMIRK
jgi:hypothetical protein